MYVSKVEDEDKDKGIKGFFLALYCIVLYCIVLYCISCDRGTLDLNGMRREGREGQDREDRVRNILNLHFYLVPACLSVIKNSIDRIPIYKTNKQTNKSRNSVAFI